ncbi:hypothetical protein [Wenyingzhuangia sp. IMCC45574]
MKIKIIIIIISLILTSCFDGFEEGMLGKDYPGFHLLTVTNQEELGEFKGELFIGGINGGVFIPTESTPFYFDGGVNETKVAFYYDENNAKVIYFEENSWKPNMDLIENISSDIYCFLLKLPDGRQEIIKWGGGVNTAFRMDVSDGLINDFYLKLVIRKEEVIVSSRVKSEYEDVDNTQRLLPEDYVHPPL